ncbi:hypothetical protein DFH07DRAFT_776916 [Mycena maculata]|uniref:Uncharacterized protein n=1 Tax=Mycena maculata TaxID=230809 RepID=A0AAD7N4C8_9AGAR|nr:hypothetical protein DFH07DRAFT_776916 [Mycena maculata]
MATKNLSSHAARNPTRQTQPTRTRARKSSATTNSNGSTARTEKARVLAADVELHFKAVNETIQSLAVKHGQKAAYIKKLLTHGKQFKQRHAHNIRNVIMHNLSVKAKKAGEDSDLQTMLENLSREEYEEIKENLTPEERKRIMKQLDDHTQPWPRTQAKLPAPLATCATDAALPAIQDSDNSRNFFQHALGKGFFDILLKFEQWSCMRDTEAKDLDDVQSVRKQSVLLILEGKIKNKKNVDMDYVNYKVDVMHKFGMELAGWPSDIPFERLVKLTADQGREIRSGLRCSAIRWVVMTKSQREELAEEIEELGGVAALKRRKMRSDKGKSHKGKGKANNSDSEDEDGEDGEDGEDNEDSDDEDNEDDEDEEDEDEEIPQRKSTTTAASSRSKSAATAAALRMCPTSGGTPVAIAATAGTNPTPSSTAALLTNLIPTAVLTNTAPMNAIPSAAAFTDPMPTFTPSLTDPTPSAMDLNNPLMNFDHAIYDLDFSMDLSAPTNPSANRGLGLTDAFSMRPLQTPRFVFLPVHGYGVPPARDTLALTGDDSAFGMPPLPGSFGADSAYDEYMSINHAMPRLPNPNPQDYNSDDHAQGMAPLGEATNTEQPAQWKRGRVAEGTDGAPAAKKSQKGGAWTTVTFGDDAQPKPARKTRKRKDAADAGA